MVESLFVTFNFTTIFSKNIHVNHGKQTCAGIDFIERTTSRKTTKKTTSSRTSAKKETKKSDAKKRIEKKRAKKAEERKNRTLQVVVVLAIFLVVSL